MCARARQSVRNCGRGGNFCVEKKKKSSSAQVKMKNQHASVRRMVFGAHARPRAQRRTSALMSCERPPPPGSRNNGQGRHNQQMISVPCGDVGGRAASSPPWFTRKAHKSRSGGGVVPLRDVYSRLQTAQWPLICRWSLSVF